MAGQDEAREQLTKLLNDRYYGVGHTAMPILLANRDLVIRALGISTLTYKDGCEAWVVHGPHHEEGRGH